MQAADLPLTLTIDQVASVLQFTGTTAKDKVAALVRTGVLHPIGGLVEQVKGRDKRPSEWRFARRELLEYIGEPQPADPTAGPAPAGAPRLRAVGGAS